MARRRRWRSARPGRGAARPGYPGRIACFLAHLAVEKALKATLIDSGVPFKKTHDLVHLHAMCAQAGRLEQLDIDKLRGLNPWAIDGRYADDLRDASREAADEAARSARAVVAAVRAEFDNPQGPG